MVRCFVISQCFRIFVVVATIAALKGYDSLRPTPVLGNSPLSHLMLILDVSVRSSTRRGQSIILIIRGNLLSITMTVINLPTVQLRRLVVSAGRGAASWLPFALFFMVLVFDELRREWIKGDLLLAGAVRASKAERLDIILIIVVFFASQSKSLLLIAAAVDIFAVRLVLLISRAKGVELGNAVLFLYDYCGCCSRGGIVHYWG